MELYSLNYINDELHHLYIEDREIGMSCLYVILRIFINFIKRTNVNNIIIYIYGQ